MSTYNKMPQLSHNKVLLGRKGIETIFLSLVTDHWIGEVIKWTGGVGQATPGVRCPQHRVDLCPVTLKQFRETLSAKDKEKQLK
jgi:hypothetical protein